MLIFDLRCDCSISDTAAVGSTMGYPMLPFGSTMLPLDRRYWPWIFEGSTGLLALMGTLTVLTNVLFLVVCFVLFVLGEVCVWGRGRPPA